MRMRRNIGTVVEWHPARGHGRLRADGGAEFFVGRRDLMRYGIQNLQIGQRVYFDGARDGLGRVPRAVNLRVLFKETCLH
jgi:cold shock CspA family protein